MREKLQKLTYTQFHDRAHLPDWRVVLGRVEARFVAGSFPGAAPFVEDNAVAAEAADHHPDVALRYPGVVQVAIVTHAAGGLTEADIALATTISALASSAGITSQPTAPSRVEV